MGERHVTFEPTAYFAGDWRVVSSTAVMLNGRLVGRIWAVQERPLDEPEWRYRGEARSVSGRGLATREEAVEGLLKHFQKRSKNP